MPTIFEIPKINPLRAIWQTDKIPQDAATGYYGGIHPSYNQKNFDADFFLTSLRFYEDKRNYIQPYQQSDKIIFQWLSEYTTTGHFAARLLMSNGDTFIDKTVSISQISGTYDGLKAYRVAISLYDVPEGVYFLQVEYNGGGSTRYYVISEPFDVKQVYANTVQIAYVNSYNDFSYIFEATVIPQLRLHGIITDVNTESKFKVYEDQPLNTEMVSGIQYRSYTLALTGVPEWMAEKVDRLLLCDSVKVDGLALTRAEGAKLEVKKNDRIAIADYQVKLRDRYNLDSLSINTSIIVGDIPTTSNFWVELMVLHGVSTNIRLGFNGARNFLDYLNSSQLTTFGFWSMREDYKLLFTYYTGQTSGGAITLLAANILQYSLQMQCQKNGAGDTLELDITRVVGSITYAVVRNGGLATTNKTSTATPINISAVYTDSQVHECTIYFDDSSCETITDSSSTCLYRRIGGDLPPTLTTYDITSTTCELNTVGNIFKYVTALERIDFTGLNIPTFGINKLIMDLYENIGGLDASCEIALQQTPPAPPTNDPALSAMKAQIAAAITTLTTD
jgi:hypothetical protein